MFSGFGEPIIQLVVSVRESVMMSPTSGCWSPAVLDNLVVHVALVVFTATQTHLAVR